MKKFVIIVAGGSGTRMGAEIPKQFIELCGKPILMHTMEVFYAFDPTSVIVLVIPQSQTEYWNELCQRHHFLIRHKVVQGGETRFQSVSNGLREIDDDGVVFIHDGVRPLVSHETLERCFDSATRNGNAIPVLPVKESLRMRDGTDSRSVDRSLFYSVQTPQTFKCSQILEAYKTTFDPLFTDDASVVEKMGLPISMVEGNSENIKITTPDDLIIADAFMKIRYIKS